MRRHIVTILLSSLVGTLAPARAFAAVPQTLTQQGRLLNTDGTPVTSPVRMIFNIYDSSSSTTPLWTETQSNVMLDNGAFSVQLGSVTAFPSTLWTGATLYLGVTIGNDAEMTPREQITSVPYALMSAQADNASQLDGKPASAYALASQLTGGTVTSVVAGTGLTGGTITTAGTLAVDFTQVAPAGHSHTVTDYKNSGTALGQLSSCCPAGKNIISGGCYINSGAWTAAFIAGNCWYCNFSPNAGAAEDAHAYCM